MGYTEERLDNLNKLKGSETGLGWDVAEETIAATDEWWDRKLMVCFL